MALDREDLLAAALEYAALGYAVFPCVPGAKHPITPRGFKDATTDPVQIEGWWREWPSANIAMPTQGLLVIDQEGPSPCWPVDSDSKRLDLAKAPTAVTPSGGVHSYFRQPPDKAWPSSVKKLGNNVDTRANGGYVLLPPSAVADKPYRWQPTLELDVRPEHLPLPPAWLISQLDSLCETKSAPSSSNANTIPEGQRNTTLASLAGTMRRVGMSEPEILAALTQANADRCKPPLQDREVAKIAQSVARYEPDPVSVAVAEDHFAQDLHTASAPFASAREVCESHRALRKPVIHGLLREGETMNVIAAPKTGKALAVDTPILTDKGWVLMRDIRPGMKVHTALGTLTEVIAISEIMRGRPCYRITTQSGASVIADENHQWLAMRHDYAEVVTTKELRAGLQETGWKIGIPGPLERKAVKLPLAPWLLGYILGNKTGLEDRIHVHKPDFPHIFSKLLESEFDAGFIEHIGEITEFLVIMLKPKLQKLGFLDNKHIPQEYLLASREQREALLAGLLDGGGRAQTTPAGYGIITFCTNSLPLAEQVQFLCRTLSKKASLGVYHPIVGDSDTGIEYRVTFASSKDLSPFSLDRHTEALPDYPVDSEHGLDPVVSVTPVRSVPVRCIQVAHASGTYLAGKCLLVTHNSWLVHNLGLSVVTGMPWLGFPTEPGRVLLIDNELHEETLANRLPRVAGAMELPERLWMDGLFVRSLRGKLEDLFRMEAYFQSLPKDFFKLIILDAFYRFLPRNVDENDNGTMANLYNLLDRCATRLNTGFVLIHHTSKGIQSGKSVTDVGAGAGSQSRAADCHFILRPHEIDGCLSVDAVARSWPPPGAFVIRQEFPLWHPDPAFDPRDLKKPDDFARKRTGDVEASGEESGAPPEIEWTIETFVAEFISEVPRTKAMIQASANDKDISDYAAAKFVEKAHARGLIHRWAMDLSRSGYATVPQPSLLPGEKEKAK